MKDMILLEESLESIVRLSDEDAGSLVKALATGDTENLSEIAAIIFPLIKGQVERMADLREKRSAAGRIGGSKREAKRSKTEANAKQNEAPVPVPVPEPVPNLNQNKGGRFTPPTTDEVRAYAQEKGLRINADRFVDFYSSKGWMVGKSKMKDWRAAVRSWAARDRQEAPEKTDYRTMMIAHAYGEAST